MNQSFAIALLATLVLAACATTPAPSEPGTGLAAQIFEVDPRAGWMDPSAAAAASASAFEKAIADLAAGRRERGQQRLGELERKSPAYAPATLALGALALESGDASLAAPKIEAAAKTQPGWLAAEYYLARLEIERGNLEGAAARLRPLASVPGAPAAIAERLAAVETSLFDRFYQAAAGAPPAAAVATLRRALALRPESTAARLLLVENLIAGRNFTEARMEIDPLLQVAGADSPEVQRALAEIDAGRGRFEESIGRYERIVRVHPRPEYLARLAQIKEEFAIANMPPRFRAAALSPAVTRADLATLVYWTVSGIRFGRPPAEPAVAIDIADAEARDEIVRAISFGLLSVDPVTRRVDPDRTMSSPSVARVLFRVAALTANPPCLTVPGVDSASQSGILKMLGACGVDVAALSDPALPVRGSAALAALRKIDAMRVR